MPKYKLVYFNARGRAELARFILASAAIEYEDQRIQGEQWAELKGQTPQGTLPYLEVDGEKFPQSMTIVRFLSRENDLFGDKSKKLEWPKIDSILDYLSDMSGKLIAHYLEKDESRKNELWKKLSEETLPNTLKYLENMIQANKEAGFIVGKKLSVADLAMYTFFENVLQEDPYLLDPYQGIKDLRAKVAALPRIAKWLKDRPETKF